MQLAGVTLFYLPARLRPDALELREAINQGDAVQAAALTTKLEAYEPQSGALVRWISVTKTLHLVAQELQTLSVTHPSLQRILAPAIGSLLGAVQDRLTSDAEFATDDGREQARAVSASALRLAARRYVAAEQPEPSLLADVQVAADHLTEADVAGPGSVPDRSPYENAPTRGASQGLMTWVLGWAVIHRVAVLGGLSTLVAVSVGVTSQFLNQPAFASGFGDYVALFSWAFALQIAGTTLAEMAGKLAVRAPR